MATSSRRGASLALLVALLSSGLAISVALRRGKPALPPPPDILLVVWDTCRADRVSTLGYRLPTTPRLDALAKQGVAYRACITPSPWTPPSHASLFTGLLPLHHGLREEAGDRVHPDLPLLAATLRQAGYETVAVPANPLLDATGLLEGFETVLPTGRGDVKGRSPEVVAKVEEWIRNRDTARGRRPLFLFVNLMDAHLPLDPEREDLLAVHGETGAARVPATGCAVDEPAALAHLAGLRRVPDADIEILSLAYDGGVHRADRATGRILELFEGITLRDAAVVAVAGDHGESLGEHGELEHRLSIHDGVLRVPLVVRWPGRLEAGRVEEGQVRLQDLYPTLLEAARVPVPPGCGRDARTLAESPLRPRDAISMLSFSPSVIPSLRQRAPDAPAAAFDRYLLSRTVLREAEVPPGTLKLVQTRRLLPDGSTRLEKEELFDLRTDPGEERDVLPSHGAAAERMRARYEGLLR